MWRVRKTFKKGGGQSLLDFSRDGRDFTTDKRGREVDGTLSEMLGWGARPPGGKGRRPRHAEHPDHDCAPGPSGRGGRDPSRAVWPTIRRNPAASS